MVLVKERASTAEIDLFTLQNHSVFIFKGFALKARYDQAGPIRWPTLQPLGIVEHYYHSIEIPVGCRRGIGS